LRLVFLSAALLSLAPGRETFAQLSTPWDPDFAEQPKPAVPPPVTAAEEPVIVPSAGPFLLLDRRDPKRIFETVAVPSTAPVQPKQTFLEFVGKIKPFAYSEERFMKARTAIEQGRAPAEPSALEQLEAEEIAVSTEPIVRPPPPELELPSQQMSLSITGRKIIGFQFSEKRFLQDQAKTGRAATTNLFDIQQELQLRMQGKVGPKITINVDYDDTKTNAQDISIVYQGYPNEVVQIGRAHV
jgi:hypothetical protein